MIEGVLNPDHIPPTELPPETMEESDLRVCEGGEEEEEEEEGVVVILKDAAPLSISPPAASLTYLSSPKYSLKKRNGGRRKKISNVKQRAIAEHRLELLKKNFRPISFHPGKTLDFSAHEQLFIALGLWEFCHLDLSGGLRADLLSQLIAYYEPSCRRSYVYGARLSVSRTDLARAIGLPSKKEKVNAFEGNDFIKDLVCADGAIPLLLDFMSNYLLFEDDMCILPPEIIQAIQFVKEGVAYKVDWASVMWVLVEKELLEAPKTGSCCYASHLQRLILHQNPSLLSNKIEPVFLPEAETEEEEDSVADEVVLAEMETNVVDELHLAEEEDDDCTRKMRSLEDLVNVASERQNSEFGLTLGESIMNDFDDCKMNEESQWFEEGKNVGFGQCMQRCNSKAFDSIDFENLTKADGEEKQEERFTNDLQVKFSNMEMMTSSDHLVGMENVNNPYAQQVNQLLTSHPNSHKNIVLEHGSSDSIYFGTNGKRTFNEIVHGEEGQFDHNDRIKMMRNCDPWGGLCPPSFDECIDQIHSGLKRANVLFCEKDQEVVNMEMQVQFLNQSVLEKEGVIRSLKTELEEQQNWQMAIRQYEIELCLVSQMMVGYKRALKETRTKFSEYRKMHPHEEESLYKDVPGEGGLVLSVREFEKYRLMQEESKRQELLGTFDNLKQILNKLQECEGCIMVHDAKLRKVVGEMKKLKEGFVRSSCSDT